MNPGREGLDSISRATHLVGRVFKEVHEEFRLWKEDYASRILCSVARPEVQDDTASSSRNSESSSSKTKGRHPRRVHQPSTSESIKIWDYETGTMELVPLEVTRLEAPFHALPAHEYCTPISRNVFQGDDPHDLAFLPFADDPTFDHAKYLEEYDSVSWLESVLDPDVEVVVVETVRRLHKDHGIQYRHIDETGILPLELLDRNGSRGMIYRSRRRDFPDWPPGIPASEKRLQDDTTPIAHSPDKKLAVLVSNFCTNLNCLVGFCSTHLDPMPMPLTTPPLVRSQRMKELASAPCGTDCFSLQSHDDQPVRWNEPEIKLLCTILDFSPDTLPCDLATICAKPCWEVFHFRRTILPDAAIERKRTTKGKAIIKGPRLGRTASSLKFDDLDTGRFTPGKPCRHDGPCDATAQCACFLNKAHCESSCRCSRKCTRRWRGCACSSKTAICSTERCACYLAHRECDPELCLKCQAKHAVDAKVNLCQNADIQRGRWKRTTVAPAAWGMGLFMAEAADVDQLIIEYVGELIYDPTTDSREPIAVHRGRNYLFELNSTLSVDGTYAGNAARYINHDARAPNCRARVRMVNGEHRIGIYATKKLTAGEEVLFNYGKHFFTESAGKA